MKKTLFTLLCFGLTYVSFGQLSNNNNTPVKAGIEVIRSSEFSNLPSYLKFQSGYEIELDQLEQWMKVNLKMSDQMGLLLLRSEKDGLGYLHYRYQQTFNGTPLEDAIWIAHTKSNRIESLNGLVYSTITAPTTPLISDDEALAKALNFVGATTYKWEIESEEQHLKWESGDINATYYPQSELVYIASSKNFDARSYRLVYKYSIYAQAPLYRAEVYVDAVTGAIIRENKLIHHVDTPGIAHTGYSGAQPIISDSFGGQFRLRDGTRGLGVRTFDMNKGISYGESVDFTDTDNDWNNVNPDLDEYATDAHFGAEMTYDYYFGIHGRNSLDDAGFQLNSYVHYDNFFFNAFWDGERMTYGDGDGIATPLTTLDIAGHEVTHGLTNMTADLIYAGESGALNESFSDIFGTAIEHFARPSDWNWLLGDEIGVTIRSMSNPNDFSCPDTYGGDFWDPFEEVHTNSGVQNFWYYLMTEGGAGVNDIGNAYTVTGVGFEVSDAIAFRNLTVYLTPSSNYAEARYFAIQSAVDLYGGCSFEVEQTTNAWYAVGVGSPYSTDVIAAFTPSETIGCTLPFTINFSNESVNGITYLWDFGDGTTSTDAFPTHTFTTAGIFDVKLSVDGGVCGEDELISIGLITIDESLDCPVIFPSSGSGGVLTACSGTLFDSGDSDGNYPSDQNAQITISPADALNVQLNFLYFDVEEEASCGYDRLNIYDGPSTGSPLIGSFCNSNPPPAITSTGPSITLLFQSDYIYEFGGFEIEWSCIENSDDSGINETENEFVSIYPNPTNNWITIATPTLNQGSIEITDILGQRIYFTKLVSHTTQFDFQRKNADGVYFVHIYDELNNLITTEKVIVN